MKYVNINPDIPHIFIANLIGNSVAPASKHRAAQVCMCLFLFEDDKKRYKMTLAHGCHTLPMEFAIRMVNFIFLILLTFEVMLFITLWKVDKTGFSVF